MPLTTLEGDNYVNFAEAGRPGRGQGASSDSDP